MVYIINLGKKVADVSTFMDLETGRTLSLLTVCTMMLSRRIKREKVK